MLSVLAYMPNVISSEFVIGYDGEFRNNTLVPINLLDGAISQISVLSSGDYDNACIH